MNGTTGKPVGPVKVVVVDPRHGMVTEEEIRTDAEGKFSAPGLNDKISMFLVQVSHQGVTYTEIVQPLKDVAEVEIEVYDTTPSWEGVRVSLPHFMARVSQDTLSIDRLFIISNLTNPPRTVVGHGAGFKVRIPEEKLRIASVFATSLGFPISMDPRPTDTPGEYTIEFPFKPGETQVGVSFDVAYPESGYVYSESLFYPLDELVVMAESPDMEIISRRLELGEPQEIRGSKAYRLSGLQRGAELDLAFRGGAAPAQPHASGHEIAALREPRETVSVALIASLTLLLVLVLAFAAKSSPVETDRDAVLASRRDAILARIARLDDLFEMGTVPEPLYREKRTELIGTLAPIMHRMDRGRPGAAGSASKNVSKALSPGASKTTR